MFKSKVYVESAEILIDFLLFVAGKYSDKSHLCECLADVFAPLVSESASHLQDGSSGESRMFFAINKMPFHFRGKKGAHLAAANKRPEERTIDFKERDSYHAGRFAFGYFQCLSLSSDPNTAAHKNFKGKPDPFHELAERYQLTLFELFRERHGDLLASPLHPSEN